MQLLQRVSNFLRPGHARLRSEIENLRSEVERAKAEGRAGMKLAKASRMRLEQERKRNSGQASGVDIISGRYNYESNAAMRGSARWETIEQMTNDPHIAEALRHIVLPLQLGEWDYQPVDDTPKAQEHADFLNAALLGKPNDRFGSEFAPATDWKTQRLPEILDFLPSGYSLFWFDMRTVGRYRVFNRLRWLEPSSVDPQGWKLDDDDQVVEIQRTYRTPTNSFRFADPVYPDEILLYTYGLKGARYEGRAFTRPLYGPWFRKDFVQRMAMIWVQKVGAPSVYGIFPRGWPDEMKGEFMQFIEQTIGGAADQNYFTGEFDKDGVSPVVKYAGIEGDPKHLNPVLESENLEIAHGAGQKTMSLGETQSGSRALGGTLGMIEQTMIEATAEIVAANEIGITAGIPGPALRLMRENYNGNIPVPRLVVSKINKLEDIEMYREALPAIKAGLIPKTPEVRKQYAERFGFKLPDDAYEIEENPFPPSFGDDEKTEPEETDEPEREEEDERAAAERLAFEKRSIEYWLAPDPEGRKGPGRGLTRLEATVLRLEAVQKAFSRGDAEMTQILDEYGRKAQGEIVGRVRAGKINKRNIESQRRSKSRTMKAFEKRVAAVLDGIGERGSEHVRGEAERAQSAK